jgi:glutamate carboxypeptidase
MTKRILVLVLLVFGLSARGATLTAPEQRMSEWIDAHAEDAIALLEETVNIGSGTMNHEGVREVGAGDAPRARRPRPGDTLGRDAGGE